ncbi:MAG TPA: DegT/DnrJ/EryC1/StrS family aminotransferase [Pyrinomonadaceae bacterium]|nr:DegT/DnrJ/EryC1/StrS family aminotransferase [Pyrinomonadaceae bacterium]
MPRTINDSSAHKAKTNWMKVPLLDLQGQHLALRSQLLDAITRVVDSQQFVLGFEVEALENEIASYCTTKFAVGCASGTDALLLALMALDLKPGDEVITTPFSFFATAGSMARIGVRPRFVDIEPRTYNLNPALVERAITSSTRALMPVHLYGQCADMDPLLEISRRRALPIVEDAAQAIGSEDRGRRGGSMGQIGCFSFYPTKNLGGAGDGGMLTTNDADLAARLKRLRVHGGETEYHHREVGINSRLDALQAAVLRVKLKYLDEWSEAKRAKAERYAALLRESKLDELIVPPFVRTDGRHIFHQFVVRVGPQRDRLLKYLAENGIGSKVYYPVPLHLQECFAFLGYREGDFPEAERAALETLALPCFPELLDEQQVYVVETLRKFSNL